MKEKKESKIISILKKYQQTLIYTSFSLLGTGIDFIFYTILFSVFKIHVSIAEVFGYIAGTTFCFIMNKKITFKERSGNVIDQMLRYIIGCIIAVTLTDLLLSFFHLILHWNAFISKIIAMVIVFFVNYIFINKFVFGTFQPKRKNKKAAD